MMVGPYQTFAASPGATADLFLLRYGKDGQLRSPRTAEVLENVVLEATDVFLFAHGWNNVFAEALNRYRNFIQGYIAQRTQFGVQPPTTYRPVLIGVIWPSTSFVMPGEQGPEIAGVAEVETESMRVAVGHQRSRLAPPPRHPHRPDQLRLLRRIQPRRPHTRCRERGQDRTVLGRHQPSTSNTGGLGAHRPKQLCLQHRVPPEREDAGRQHRGPHHMAMGRHRLPPNPRTWPPSLLQPEE
jgi:hypothetical protein